METSTPNLSQDQCLLRIHDLSRLVVAATWIYHGLVPKVLFRDWTEMTLLHDLGVNIQFVPALLQNLGFLEIAFGLLTIALWRTRWPLWATIGIMLGSVLSVAKYSPKFLHAAFNPVTLNGLMLGMAVIALLSQPFSRISASKA